MHAPPAARSCVSPRLSILRTCNLLILIASFLTDVYAAAVIRLGHVQGEVFPDESSMEKEDPQSGHSGGLWKGVSWISFQMRLS